MDINTNNLFSQVKVRGFGTKTMGSISLITKADVSPRLVQKITNQLIWHLVMQIPHLDLVFSFPRKKQSFVKECFWARSPNSYYQSVILTSWDESKISIFLFLPPPCLVTVSTSHKNPHIQGAGWYFCHFSGSATCWGHFLTCGVDVKFCWACGRCGLPFRKWILTGCWDKMGDTHHGFFWRLLGTYIIASVDCCSKKYVERSEIWKRWLRKEA